jgi:hypothetical protein
VVPAPVTLSHNTGAALLIEIIPRSPVHSSALALSTLSDHMSARLDRVRALSSAYSALQQDLPLLEERVELLRAIIADETTLDAPLARYQHHLGAALYERFLHLNEISYLIEAEACLRLAIPHLSLEPSDVGPGIILGSVLREQAYDTRSRMLAEEALALHRQPFLVNLEMPDLEQAHHCRELGLTLRICYFIDANRGQDLLESVQHLQAARAIFTRMGIIDHACTAGLILALINLYNVQADQALLNEASPIGDLALAQCEPNHRDFYRVVWSVATVYRFRAWVLDDSLALLKTLGILRKALVHAPPGWATPLSVELLDLLRLQFMKQGNDDDLSEAVALATTLLDRLSPEAPRWDQLQASLAHNLLLRFRMTGAVADIENAVHAAQSALSRTNVGTARYFLKLNQLAECRDAQYLAFGDMMHLNDCIASTELIVQLAPSHSTDRRLAEHNLIDSLRLRSKVTGSLDDLDRAIALVPESFKSQVFDHPNAASMLHGIGQTFLSRFKMTGSRDDLERATAWIYEATQRCKNRRESSQHFKHHIIMNAYAKLLRIRYEVLDEADGVAMALTEQRELANTMPAIHADRASILCGLAQTLICANKLDSGHEYVEEALNCLLDALSISHCPAYRRLKDVANVLTYLTKSPPCLNHDETFKLSGVYSQTISLLPQVASFGLDPRTRLSVISSSGRLTGQGASHAIAVGQYELALEMLEAGRNVFWTQGLHIRTAFTNLPPEIGDRLTGITTALGQPMPEYSDQGSAKERELARRRRLGDDFAAVLMEARSLPGFEDLLRNASFASLARTAQQHPIVVLVAGENVGYALIIDEGAQVILVTLEKANEANLRALSHRIEMHSQHIRSSRGIRKVQAVAQAGLDDVYQELWISVMLPIVDALGLPVSVEYKCP